MTATSPPSVLKNSLTIAAGIVIAAVVLFAGAAVVAGIAESENQRSQLQAAEQASELTEIYRCRDYTLKGSGVDCRVLIDAYRAKWQIEP